MTFADGEASGWRRAWIAWHLRRCSGCSEWVKEYAAAMRALSRLDQPARAPGGLAEVLERIQTLADLAGAATLSEVESAMRPVLGSLAERRIQPARDTESERRRLLGEFDPLLRFFVGAHAKEGVARRLSKSH